MPSSKQIWGPLPRKVLCLFARVPFSAEDLEERDLIWTARVGTFSRDSPTIFSIFPGPKSYKVPRGWVALSGVASRTLDLEDFGVLECPTKRFYRLIFPECNRAA